MKAKLGLVDLVVNNAALVMAVPLEDMSFEDIRAFYEVNCMAAAFVSIINLVNV